MATAKQLAALKKARAARKRNLAKKNAPKKRVAKKNAAPKKRTAKKAAPKKRVSKNGYVLVLVDSKGKNLAYWTGGKWDTSKLSSKWYASQNGLQTAANGAKKVRNKLAVAKYRNAGIGAIKAKK